jgi:hypothetical protein
MLQNTCPQFKLFCERAFDENRALREENIELKSNLKAAQAALRRQKFFLKHTCLSAAKSDDFISFFKIMLCIIQNLWILMTIHILYWNLVN